MSILDYIEKIKQENEGPRITDQEPRTMYQDGQLVQNTADGSRPGYKGPEPSYSIKEINKVVNQYDNYLLWSFCYFTGLGFLIISFICINRGFEYEKNRLIELEQSLIINELNEYKNCCDDGRSNKKKNKKTS